MTKQPRLPLVGATARGAQATHASPAAPRDIRNAPRKWVSLIAIPLDRELFIPRRPTLCIGSLESIGRYERVARTTSGSSVPEGRSSILAPEFIPGCESLRRASGGHAASASVGHAAAAAALALLLALTSLCSASPTSAPPPPAKPVVVLVNSLRDAGGLVAVTASGDAINVSYSSAIRRYLTAGGYEVVDKTPRGNSPSYSVEGDLSHLTIDASADGPYLCVLRLYSVADGKHDVVGQWAGVARSLRYLTANLDQSVGVDTEGLLGELGDKIAQAIQLRTDSTGASTLASVVAAGSSADIIDAFPVDVTPSLEGRAGEGSTPSPEGRAGEGSPGQVLGGQSYRLQIRSTVPGTMVLVDMGKGDAPVGVLTPDAVRLDAGKPVLAPVDTPISFEQVTAPTDHELLILLRPDQSTEGASDGEPLPVEILADTTPLQSTVANPAIAKLLLSICADPPGTWLAHTVVLHVARSAGGQR